MKKIEKNDHQKRKKEKRLRLLLVCIEVFLLVVVTGGMALFLLHDSKQGDLEEVSSVQETEEGSKKQETLNANAQAELDDSKYGKLLKDANQMKENNIYTKDTSSEEQVTLLFGGDILFDDSYAVMNRLRQRENGIYDCMDEALLKEMRDADIFMLNNEFTYTARGTATAGKSYTFRSKPENIAMLNDLGVDIVSLANNHAYDFGEISLLDTLETLSGAGIPYVGAGKNLEEAVRPTYFIANDIKIAYLSATQIERLDNPDTREATETSPGVFRCWNPEKLLAAIKTAKENSDFVVVYVHWGTENESNPDWAQLEQAPLLAEAGADLIVGDHTHCLQGIAFCGDTPVIYSLGNFWFSSKTLDTGLLKVAITKQGMKSVQFLPAQQDDCKTSLLANSEKERVLAIMRGLSAGVLIDQDGYVKQP